MVYILQKVKKFILNLHKYNDTYIDLGKSTEKNTGIIFEVPETGSYEFSITNLSDERVFYTNTTIYQEVSSNEEN